MARLSGPTVSNVERGKIEDHDRATAGRRPTKAERPGSLHPD
jgi:hypothetical protein